MLRGRSRCASDARGLVGGSQADVRAWGLAQLEDALVQAAMRGDLAVCTRLLGSGTHPVGWNVSEPAAAVCCTPLSMWQVLQSDRGE